MQLLHAGGLSFVAEIPAAADRPTSVLKEDVAVALGSSALCDASMRAPARQRLRPACPFSYLPDDLMLASCRPAVVAARESLGWEPIASRVRLRECKGTEVGKVLQERKTLKSVRQFHVWTTTVDSVLRSSTDHVNLISSRACPWSGDFATSRWPRGCRPVVVDRGKCGGV